MYFVQNCMSFGTLHMLIDILNNKYNKRLTFQKICVCVVCMKTIRTYDKRKSYIQDTHKYTVFGSLKNGPFI